MRRWLAPVAALALAACSGGTPDAPERADWPHYGGQYDEAGYAALDQINRSNVDRLRLAWSLDLPGQQSLEATPLAIDGVLYFTGTYSDVFAVSVETGTLLWKHEAKVYENNKSKMNFIFPLNRGVAYADGRVFSATTDGRLLALDAKTGALIWSVETVERDDLRYITGAPRAFDGKVMIGQGGGDTGQRGYVTAYSQQTGKQVWRFYTVPGSPEENAGDAVMQMAAGTWTGEYWKTGTGGTAWHGMTYDPELAQVYIGTGNSGPYDPEVRSPGGGDNLFLASIVALDADTGAYKWHYQVNPREAWDFKATAGIVTAELEIEGTPRKVLMQAPTNGFFYVIDRETGELLSAEKFGKATWADSIDIETGRPVERPGIRYQSGSVDLWPWTGGAHNWQAMSYSPETGLVYIPYMELGFTYSKDPTNFTGMFAEPVKEGKGPHEGQGALIAWDPVKQEARWTKWYKHMWNGGALSTAGGLVFQGTTLGKILAYDAESGDELWTFDAGLGIVAPPITYSWKGTQYVSILVGWVGPNPYGNGLMPTGWRWNAQPRRLLTFRLDGEATLPPTAPYDETVTPLDDAALAVDPAKAKAGRAVYHLGCHGCHGGDLQSSGAPAPDLRESALSLDKAAFLQVVREGSLLAKGMPQFGHLSAEQVDQLWHYVRQGARAEIARQKTSRNLKTAQ